MGSATFDFSGKTVLVTGAARGIGAAVAEAMHRDGARVYAADLDWEDWRPGPTRGTEPERLALDVTKTREVDDLVDRIVGDAGRLDIVINAAGILRDGVIWKTDDLAWNEVLDVHVSGSFRVIRAATPAFRAQGWGRVINVTSYVGLHGNFGQANYASAKAGLIGLTKTAAKELGRFGVTVNAVCPNAETRMTAGLPEDVRDSLLTATALGRFAEAAEIAPVFQFLCTEDAGYVTGSVVHVDGGLSA